ncbi:MAG: DUF4118 domain-containing protein [Clostridiales bacterium]|nr:DUF4118 domain-containing protein [Clostridiales bacterium]
MTKFCTPTVKNIFITIAIVAVATVVCVVLQIANAAELPIHLIFVLAVLIVSRLTDGFVYGIVTSVVAVFIINYAFTYPFFAFNFTITGYPVTFITLFVVAVITSTLTTQVKKQQAIRAEAEREKLYADLLRAISHDLRTPLTSIVGSTSAMLDGDTRFSSVQKRELLSEIRDDASWLIRMVENILSVTRIRGETNIQKKQELIEELVGGIVDKFRKRYLEAQIVVSMPDDVVFVPMDATLIGQVVMNLLENAVMHGTGMTRITFSVRLEEDEAVFSVENDGDIIDAGILHKYMEGGFISSGEPQIRENRSGLGLGLSVCAAIVKAHGGKMFVHGNAEGGVCVGFSLLRWEDEGDGAKR